MASYPAPNTQTGLFNPNDFPTTTEVLGGFEPTKILVTNNIGSVTASNTSSDKIQFYEFHWDIYVNFAGDPLGMVK